MYRWYIILVNLHREKTYNNVTPARKIYTLSRETHFPWIFFSQNPLPSITNSSQKWIFIQHYTYTYSYTYTYTCIDPSLLIAKIYIFGALFFTYARTLYKKKIEKIFHDYSVVISKWTTKAEVDTANPDY